MLNRQKQQQLYMEVWKPNTPYLDTTMFSFYLTPLLDSNKSTMATQVQRWKGQTWHNICSCKSWKEQEGELDRVEKWKVYSGTDQLWIKNFGAASLLDWNQSKKTATYIKHLDSRNNQQLFNSNCITLCLRDDFPVGSSHTKSVNFQNVPKWGFPNTDMWQI